MRRDTTNTDSKPTDSPRRRPRVRSLGWAQGFAVGEAIDVSVCIVNWNNKDLLRGCLQSLLEEPQGVQLEVIVVDNGSTDGAAEMVANEFPEVTLVRNGDNAGFSRANNQAAIRARGRFLFFLNNDTVVPPHALERLAAFAQENPEVGMIGPRLRDAAGHLQISYRQSPSVWALLHRTLIFRWTGLLRRTYRRYRRGTFEPDVQKRVQVLMGAAVFLPREAFAEAGGWDESYTFGGEDIDLSRRVNRRRPVVYLPSVEVTHFGRASSRQNVHYTEPNVAIGYARYLRSSGSSAAALGLYKFVVTLDAPVQLTAKAAQYAWRRLRGNRAKAGRTQLALAGHWSFLTRGLRQFWRV